LGDCYLTDDLDRPNKTTLPAGTIIPAGGFLLVWADDSPRVTNTADLHLTFRLGQEGESLGLFAPDGTAVDTVQFGRQRPDVSQGRWPDGADPEFRLFPVPTPRASNVLPTSRHAPRLTPVDDQTVNLGHALTLQVSATDADVPAQTLTFALAPEAPAGAHVQPDGRFAWTPTASGVYPITVRVTDDGSPSLSDETGFVVTVRPATLAPRISRVVRSEAGLTLTWLAEAGQTCQLQFKADLNDPVWMDLGDPVPGAAESSATDHSLGGASER
jgi:hypothetical protein